MDIGADETDFTAPVVVATAPANGAVGVLVEKTILVTLSEDVLAGVQIANITVKKGRNLVPTNVSVVGNTIVIDPVALLAYRTIYTVTVPAGAVDDLVQNPLTTGVKFSFETRRE